MTTTTTRIVKGETILNGTCVALNNGTLHQFTSAAGTTSAIVYDDMLPMLAQAMIRTAKSAHA